MRRHSPAAICVALVCTWLAACAEPQPPVRVVLVTIDTLRWDDFAGGPDEPSRMPFTRSWAAKGQLFTSFYATTSTTQPTHASLFTGLPPWEHGVTRNGQVLGEDAVTVAERLRAAGFTTAAVVASFPLEARFGLSQGFDVYEAEFEQGLGKSWEGVDLEGRHFYSLADAISERAIARLDAMGRSDQFLWVHYFDPHAPYGDSSSTGLPINWLYHMAKHDPGSLDGLLDKARRLYGRDLISLDAALSRLLTKLDADTDWTTHVVFTSDHGESFGEHGALGHGTRVTPEQVHVPLFVVSPRLAAGTRSDAAESSDLAVTLLSLAGVRAETVPGRDLTREPAAQQPVLGMRRTFAGPQREQRTDGSEVALEPLRFFAVLDGRLYAGNSSGVEEPAWPDRPVEEATAMRLRVLFRGFEARLGATEVREAVDPETQEALRALGYVR